MRGRLTSDSCPLAERHDELRADDLTACDSRRSTEPIHPDQITRLHDPDDVSRGLAEAPARERKSMALSVPVLEEDP